MTLSAHYHPHRMPVLNLSKYLRRIGYTGVPMPTLQSLSDVVYHHATSIPFENLNPFLGMPVSLDVPDVERKLVDEGRGGYCFEQNLLLWEALQAIGFETVGLAARVIWMRPETALTPRSHMLLRVNIAERSYLADVGFGGLTLTGVLELTASVEQQTPHGPYRLIESGGDWRMQANIREEWRTLYRFDLQPQHPIDYLAPNYFASTHPGSPFVTGLSAARAAATAHYALRNRDLTVYRRDAAPEKRRLNDGEILQALEADFGITLPQPEALLSRLATLPYAGEF